MQDQTIRPLRDMILVKPEPLEERSKGGILLPRNAKVRHMTGLVLATGPGKVTDHGVRIEPDVKVGERVLVREFNALQQVDPLREGDPVVIPNDDIIAVIES